MRANADREAHGTIIEAKLDRGRGVVATVLVQRGTLKVGDLVVAGAQWGRARALLNDRGQPVETAGPPPRWRSWAWTACPSPATSWPWSTARSGPARSPSTGSASGATRRTSRPPVRAGRWRTCSPSSGSAAKASCRWWSSPTCRARWKHSPPAWSASAPMRSRCASCSAAWAPSPNPTSRWQRRRRRRSWASTSAPTPRHATWRGATGSISATTRSSTSFWTR